MKFSTNTLNEIKDRIPVSQVVGKKIQLKKKGREYVGLSPFNKEKTPSFYTFGNHRTSATITKNTKDTKKSWPPR